ncbi:hypothetical protein GCM10010361_28410 [Streptomyces olivaceiscleroticus]|uniref:Uncharacterized protein n=1 Tax=Streptomyces olivaceiscleroticus TaxID=68245 RepID=A0ABN0ZY49_9ACTN
MRSELGPARSTNIRVVELDMIYGLLLDCFDPEPARSGTRDDTTDESGDHHVSNSDRRENGPGERRERARDIRRFRQL